MARPGKARVQGAVALYRAAVLRTRGGTSLAAQCQEATLAAPRILGSHQSSASTSFRLRPSFPEGDPVPRAGLATGSATTSRQHSTGTSGALPTFRNLVAEDLGTETRPVSRSLGLQASLRFKSSLAEKLSNGPTLADFIRDSSRSSEAERPERHVGALQPHADIRDDVGTGHASVGREAEDGALALGDNSPRRWARGPLRVYLETYGCQMNVNDLEIVLGILQTSGYQCLKVPSPEQASLILINTCAIRDNAENKVSTGPRVVRVQQAEGVAGGRHEEAIGCQCRAPSATKKPQRNASLWANLEDVG